MQFSPIRDRSVPIAAGRRKSTNFLLSEGQSAFTPRNVVAQQLSHATSVRSLLLEAHHS
jgi:hypothetical protein